MLNVVESRALYSKFDMLLYFVVATVFGVGSIVAILSGFEPGATNAAPRIALGGIAVLLSAIFARIAMLRVVIRDDHLLVVNPLRTYRIPWSDVQNIDAVVFYGWKVRFWVDGRPRNAFGLCQFSKYGVSHGPKYDDIYRDAPRWLHSGYDELRKHWDSKK